MTLTLVRRRLGAVGCLAFFGFGVALAAQSRSLPDAPGVWKTWKPLASTTGNGGARDQVISPTLMKAFETELLALNAILRRAPGVTTPVGFSVETWGFVDGYHKIEYAPDQPAAGKLPIRGGFDFGAFPIFEYQKNGKTVREDTGETALQAFLINQIDGNLFDRVRVEDWGPLDTDAFQKPMPNGQISGLPRYGDGLIVTRDPNALWTPMSHKSALDLVAKARQLPVASLEESMAAYAARLAVIRDPGYRPKKLKEARESAAMAKMPNADAFVKTIEQSLDVEEKTIVDQMSPTGSTGKQLAEAKAALAEVNDWIAKLSPAEQAAPGCYVEKGATLRARFVAPGTANCRPLVRPNYGYFNASLPRSVPQVLIITGITRCFDTANKYNRDANAPGPSGCAANRALIETMDKDAVRAWVR